MTLDVLSRVGVAGYYKFDIYKADGRLRKSTGWFPNLITDAGLDAMGTSSTYTQRCWVGTGNATPDVSDTNLQTLLIGTATLTGSLASGNGGSPDYYSYFRKTYRFGVGVAAGNLTEVGVGSGTDSVVSVLFSRSLILDGGGSPTTLTVLSDEVLDVTYELRNYPPTSDTTGTISISGTPYDFTLRSASIAATHDLIADGFGNTITMGGSSDQDVTAYSGAIGAITSVPSSSIGVDAPLGNSAYGSGTFYRDFSATWGLTTVTSSIRSITWYIGTNGLAGRYQAEFNPVIPKTSSNTLTLYFRVSWGRRP